MSTTRDRTARRRRAGTTAAAVTTVLATATAFAGPAAASDAAEEPAAGERVLQSVTVAMSPDGSLTRVASDVVRVDEEGEADSTEESWSPDEVAGELPVRMLTAWRTEDGAGTDLSDLDGYTGRVRIDLTVQNLTVRPEILEYDVDGASLSRAALVGSPLTVVAAADLGDVEPSTVVTGGPATGQDVTNGVLSQDDGGDSHVQWASILAPPTLSSTAQLSLVVDATDFEVPTFDVSVQPGLVTDPSVGGLIDAAFNPGSSTELELQSRTIELVGAVNAVLARASSAISDVRANLTSSAETLGTRTIADLQSSTQTVTSSMSGLGTTLEALRRDLGTSIEATGSSALLALDDAVTVVDQMLGDTTASAPVAQVDGSGCTTSVARADAARTVYGNLLQVASQLKGYAKATDACKGALEESIVDTIGPAAPDAQSCATGGSVTCSLFGAQTTFSQIAKDLRDLSDKAIGLLNPALYATALGASNALNTEVEKVDGIVGDLNTGRIFTTTTLTEAAKALKDDGVIDKGLDTIETSLSTIHTDAAAVQEALRGTPEQIDAAAAALCDALADDTLTEDQKKAFDDALAHLQGTDCSKASLALPSNHPVPLTERFDAGDLDEGPLDKVSGIVGSTDPTSAQPGAARALSDLEETRVDLRDMVNQVLSYRKNPAQDGPTLAQLQTQLETALGELEIQRTELTDAVADLEEIAADVPDIKAEIEGAVADAQTAIKASIDEETRQVASARSLATDELGTMFERSAAGLRGAGDDVVRNGKRALGQQKKEFAKAQADAGNRISREIEEGLAEVSAGVAASTRDTEAASTLLLADLRKVLLDLGERRVGGGGLLGAMAANSATARSADFQLALATDTTTSYANVRGRDIAGILLRQAQTDAAMRALADLTAFRVDLPSGAEHRTVYGFHIGNDQ